MKLKMFLSAVLATVAMGAAATAASANTPVSITPGGAAQAIFAQGGIVFSAAGQVADCPLTLNLSLLTNSIVLADGLLNIGFVTGGNIDPNPCRELNITLLFSPQWLIAVTSFNPATGNANITILNVQVDANGCLFRGTVTATINARSGSVNAITNPSGSLSGPIICGGTATVSGTGGVLSPGQTIS